MEILAKQIHQELLRARHTLVISHQNPDGDTLGSACALLQYLKKLGKSATPFCVTPINKQLFFLPHIENFLSRWEEASRHNFDTVVVLDSGDLRYAGVARHLQSLNYRPIIINIDHHLTNERYGHHNLVIPTAAATAEVLYFFFKTNKIQIDQQMALALLTGLVTDTTHFSNSATSVTALKAGSELVAAGGNLRLIYQWLFQNKTLLGLQLWGRAFSRLAPLKENLLEDLPINSDYPIIMSYLTAGDCRELTAPDEELEGLVNFLGGVLDCPVILLLREKEDGTIKGSFRTRRDDVDVSALAKKLGGGGHKKAAGFAIKGRLQKSAQGIKIDRATVK